LAWAWKTERRWRTDGLRGDPDRRRVRRRYEHAYAVAVVQKRGEGFDGSSFVAVQQWVHDLTRFDVMSVTEQDYTIGRRKSDNEEIDDAPASAHVKRTAQESFDPEAFVLRRSIALG
jgi:putative iron-dependent peroxidase